jgi:hypothetical protein
MVIAVPHCLAQVPGNALNGTIGVAIRAHFNGDGPFLPYRLEQQSVAGTLRGAGRKCNAGSDITEDHNLGLVNQMFLIIIDMILDVPGFVSMLVKASRQLQPLNNNFEVIHEVRCARSDLQHLSSFLLFRLG